MNNAPQKKVPELRFPEFMGEWEESRLGSLLSFKNGINAPKEAYGSGYKFINVLDIINNAFITHDLIIGSVEVTPEEFSKNIVEYGDILFQRSSETREEVGQSNVYLDREQPATFGGFVIRGKKISEYEPVFMNFLLKTAVVRKEITSRSGGSTRYNIGQESISEVEIRTPIENEQKKISDFLLAVDRRIEGLEKKRDLLKEYKKGLMQQLFNQTLRFENGDKPFPKWEEKRLGEVAEIIGGGTPDTSDEKCWGGEIQWFTPTEIKTKYLQKSQRTITETGLKKSSAKLLPVGALLFSSRATIGDVGIALQPCTTNQGFQSFVTCSNASNEFLYYWIASNKKQFLRRSSGSTFLEISKSEIQKLKIQLPCLAEQKKIADFLSALDRKIESVESQVARTREFKRGLLQKMFV